MPPRTEEDDRVLLERLSGSAGLCGDCVHRRLLASARSVFLRCALADADARFPRYPRLPVLVCAGHQPAALRRP
jgi:hypothetical protein